MFGIQWLQLVGDVDSTALYNIVEFKRIIMKLASPSSDMCKQAIVSRFQSPLWYKSDSLMGQNGCSAIFAKHGASRLLL